MELPAALRLSLLVLVLCAVRCVAKCPNNCNGHGLCDKYSRCHCSSSFQGGDCSERICPWGLAWSDNATATDVAHQVAECSNRGLCNRETGRCECMDGFTGSACERLSCAKSCSEKGRCLSMHDYAENFRNDNSATFVYDSIWDAHKIQGCVCDYPATGYDCGQTLCPTGDDPLTTAQVNEVQLLRCIANTGSFVLYYRGVSSAKIPHTATAGQLRSALLAIPALTDVKITYSLPHAPVCQLQTNVISIEFTQQFGSQPPLVPVVDETLRQSGGYVDISADGITTWSDVARKKFTSVLGTKENDLCSNRGLCEDQSGTCQCFDTNNDVYGSSNGYGLPGTRGDCGYIVSATTKTVSSCPGDAPCSGHGVCDTTSFRCFCSSGWTGGDCSEKMCPLGRSWFSYPDSDNYAHYNRVECANMGTCDRRTGQCQCRPGFSGRSCESMICPGAVDRPNIYNTAVQYCSGHGRCMSMSELSLWSQSNGDSLDIIYGNDDNSADTWDAHRIHGCLCDTGYTGYDCSQRQCPQGDDPGTYEDHSEVQLLQCVAEAGNFTLSFRQSTTNVLSSNISATELQSVLSALPSIRNVSVYFALDGALPLGVLTNVSLARVNVDGIPEWGDFVGINGTFSNVTIWTPNRHLNTSFCQTDGSQVAIVHFTHTHGNLPAVRPNTTFLLDFVNGNGGFSSGKINVFTDGQAVHGLYSVEGSTENLPCNHRGLCDTSTGQCQCFDDWTSSDGARQGAAGDTGDCGYRNDKKFSYFDSH